MLNADMWSEILKRGGPLAFGSLTIREFDSKFTACCRIQRQWKHRCVLNVGDAVCLICKTTAGLPNAVGYIRDIEYSQKNGSLDTLVVQSGRHLRYIDKRSDAMWTVRKAVSHSKQRAHHSYHVTDD